MKLFHVIPIGAALALVIGCGAKNPVVTPEPEQKFSVAKSETIVRESPVVSDEIIRKQAQSNNEFAVAMYKQLREDGKNLFFSPSSITAALAMTAAGAAGNTQKQIRDALQVKLEGNAFDSAINAVDHSIMDFAAATPGITLSVVNSSWMQTGWGFKVSYLDHLAKYYGAGVNLVNFMGEPEECRIIINTWVAGQTTDKIQNLLPPGSIISYTACVLTNAIYFLADWLYAFNPENTKNQDFTLLDKSKVTAPIMTLNKPDSTVKMRYGEGSGVKALDFPYKGDRLVMTVLLPDSDAFSTVENSLSAEKLTTLFAGLDTANVKASLPKFKFTFGTVKLKAPFNALGMTDAFIGGKADFSGMDGTRDLYVDDIYHKAFISVDEKGTEAAAATAVVLNWKSIPKQPTFIVDRPFIFAIRDRVTGAILFMGRILNPLTTE